MKKWGSELHPTAPDLHPESKSPPEGQAWAVYVGVVMGFTPAYR